MNGKDGPAAVKNPLLGLEAGIGLVFGESRIVWPTGTQRLGVKFVRHVIVLVDGPAEPRVRFLELGPILRRRLFLESVAGRFPRFERRVQLLAVEAAGRPAAPCSLLQLSQSRVAKMEAGDPSVPLDLLIRSLVSLGTSERELSQIITTPRVAYPHGWSYALTRKEKARSPEVEVRS